MKYLNRQVMSSRTRPTILVVDDDPLFSFELRGTLKRAGYTVLSAAKVCDAYSLLERQQIDLAVVDLNLPDKSGLELIHTARKTRRKLKILAMTATLSDLHLEIAEYMGADLAVRKFPGSQTADDFPTDEWTDAVQTALSCALPPSRPLS